MNYTFVLNCACVFTLACMLVHVRVCVPVCVIADVTFHNDQLMGNYRSLWFIQRAWLIYSYSLFNMINMLLWVNDLISLLLHLSVEVVHHRVLVVIQKLHRMLRRGSGTCSLSIFTAFVFSVVVNVVMRWKNWSVFKNNILCEECKVYLLFFFYIAHEREGHETERPYGYLEGHRLTTQVDWGTNFTCCASSPGYLEWIAFLLSSSFILCKGRRLHHHRIGTPTVAMATDILSLPIPSQLLNQWA